MSVRIERLRPVRVLMTADAVGGVWQYALDLTGGLARYGIATTLATLGPEPTGAQREAARAAGVQDLLVTDLPLDWTAEKPESLAEAGRGLAELAGAARADLVHLNSPALAAEASFPMPVLATCHSCVATWWQAVRSGPLPDEFAWRTDLVRRGYEAAGALTAPTAAFAAATTRSYGLSRAPIVVRNGRRPVQPVSPQENCPQDFVFTAGRLWDEGKNLAVLDRAAAHLDVPVWAAGPLAGPNGARAHFARLRPLGPLGDEAVAGYLAANPIFVSTARYEPFGLAVLEAAQAGCALVLSDIPTFRELWDGAAAFVPPDDDRAIAAAIDDLIQNPVRRAHLGAAARMRARSYTVEAMTAGILAVYRSLLPRNRAATLVENAA